MPGIYTLAGTWNAGEITGEIANNSGAISDVTNTISDVGNSGVYIMMMIIGFIGIIAIGIAVVKLMVGNSVQKSESKGALLWILVGLIIGFGAIGIIGLAQTVGGSLFASGNAVNTVP